MGTFSVYRAGRVFDPNDRASHVIEVGADFNEERPFFALTEYLSYVRQQIEQTKGWADSSQHSPDAKDYWFPWHSVRGNILVEGHEPVPMKFELDRGRLLDLLVGHTIYNDATVAVRELLQNAIDAVRYRHYLEEKEYANTGRPASPMGKVIIKWDPTERELVVEDNGIGMDRSIITSHLMKVGASFYNTPQFRQEFKDYSPISRFGIGILTNFMISDDVEIVTYKADEGYRIRLTSVQADYLLKKIATGDPLLRDLEPHGTRITVKIRSSVDFKDRTMFDIVQYWIILPACEVYYHEIGKEPIKVGFNSPREALKYFHKEPTEIKDRFGFRRSIDSYVWDVRSATCKTETGEYDFAFRVRKGFTPEWRLVETDTIDAPVVCIEGIRADNTLPGFKSIPSASSSEGPLCAILSVRGNKDFRTTVSRTSLERDEEYLRVGRICTDFLLEHLKEEVERIAKTSGSPLSRASSAGQYIYASISKHIGDDTETYLQEKIHDIPIIVIEKIGINASDSRRELISSSDLSKVQEFWTIESRLVSYLGTISRDLGKELSLSEFLGTLAPELRDPRVTALIPDADEFQDEILSSHVVDSVEFSRSNQQTMVYWKLRRDKYDLAKLRRIERKSIDVETILDKLAEITVGVTGSRINRESLLFIEELVRTALSTVVVAPIRGDVKSIHGINTRVVTILEPEKPLSQAWSQLSAFLYEYTAEKARNEGYYWVLLGTAALIAACAQSRGLTELLGGREVYLSLTPRRIYRALKDIWDEATRQIRKHGVIEGAGSLSALGLGLTELIGEEDNWFDATTYWWNW